MAIDPQPAALILEAGHQIAPLPLLEGDGVFRRHRRGAGRLLGRKIEDGIPLNAARARARGEQRRGRSRPDRSTVQHGYHGEGQVVGRSEIYVQRRRSARNLARSHGRLDAVDRQRRGVRRRLHIVSAERDLLLLGVHVGHAGRGHDPQATTEEDIGILDLRIGQEALIAVAPLRRSGAATVVPLVRMGGRADLGHDPAPTTVEGALGADIDGARGSVGVDIGADGLGYFDRVQAAQRHLFEAERTRRACAVIGVGRGQIDPVQRHSRIGRRHAPQRNRPYCAVAYAVRIDARHELDELARISFRDVAVGFGGQAVLDVHRLTLGHDGPRIALSHADNDDVADPHRVAHPRHGDIQARRLPVRHHDLGHLIRVAGKADRYLRRAGGQVRQPKGAALPRGHGTLDAFGVHNLHAGVAHILARRRVDHRTRDLTPARASLRRADAKRQGAARIGSDDQAGASKRQANALAGVIGAGDGRHSPADKVRPSRQNLQLGLTPQFGHPALRGLRLDIEPAALGGRRVRRHDRHH
ncbi:hypothetical protein D3C86_1228990 [compost metagenome]